MPIVATAIAATQTVASLVNTINNISDTKKRRLYEQNLASLSYSQQEALAKVVMNQTSDEEKLRILAETLGKLNTARIEGLARVESEKEKTRKYLYTTLAIGGLIIIGGVILLSIKKRRKNGN